MKKLLLAIALLPAAVQAQEVTIAWNGHILAKKHTIYRGPAPTALVKVQDTDELFYKFDYTGSEIVCYGVSASNDFGESPIQTKTEAGEDVCVGKPMAPKGFSFSVQ